MLKRLQSRLAEMRQYETSPLVQIQGCGELPRGLPLFDSIVVYENYPIDPATPSQGSSLRIREVQYTNKNNFPITLVIMPGASFILRLTFDLARIDRSTAEGLLLNYTALLRDVLERPSARISDLRMQEGAQAQAGSDEDRNDRHADLSVHELFQLQAEMRPDDVAIVFEEERLTYSELNRQSNQVASFLIEAGVEPGSVVALFQRRSARSLVSLLGALKTGSAYLPIDVSQPDKRIALVLEDARPGVIITDRSLVERVGDNDIRKICIDTQWPEISACSQANPPRRTMPGDAVYVVYTSGSRGRPKGVVVEHRSVVNYILAIRDRMHIGQDCAMALLQPLSVDMGNTVIFPSLCFGGCLHIISEEKVLDPEAFGEYIQARSIDVLKVTPSHLSSLQKSNSPWRVMPRKALILGGEASRKEWVERLYELAPECRVFNHYGPTETTVGVLTHAIDRNGSSKSSGVVPIGRPLPNCEAYVLSRGLQLLPAGVEGELYIGGRCLARGYLNNPEMTAQKFIPNPFSNQPGSRLYETGDLARLLPDGNFEFLGRADDQIKVRGFRVEPKEIEAVALQQPGVEEAVVMGREDGSGEMRLVCYGVMRGGDESASVRLLAHLRERLPEYMIPTAIILLDKMPLTPNGKVDRDRLPLPDQSKSQSNAEYVAPRIQIEEVLAGLWSAMLDVKNVGVYDDFFSLGGHSLNMTEMAFRVNEAFQVDLPLRQVFEAQTIESLATAIVRRQAETMDEERVDRILSEIEHMSEEEARLVLSN
jgi:amino acid adenylation domain-containing protein